MPARDEVDAVDVSVLIPVRNEVRWIRDSAAAMRAQRLDAEFELLFVDGRSSDGTRQVLDELGSEDARIRVLDNPAELTAPGLNIGLAAARGKFVARMDAHAVYPPDYLAAGVARLARGDVDWVSGPQLAAAEYGWARRISLALSSRVGTGSARYRRLPAGEIEVDSGFTGMLRRSTLERLGGWDPEAWPNEDGELAARIRARGGRIVCLPEMAARYIPRASLSGLASQYWRYGQYRARTSWIHPRSMRRSHLLPPVLVATLPAALAAPPTTKRAARAALGAYVLCVVGTAARLATRTRSEDALPLALVFSTMHLAWGAGFVLGALRFSRLARAAR